MTDPLTSEEQERLGQWEGFAAVQSGNKVAEYLTSLREFLKVIQREKPNVFIRLICYKITEICFGAIINFLLVLRQELH